MREQASERVRVQASEYTAVVLEEMLSKQNCQMVGFSLSGMMSTF